MERSKNRVQMNKYKWGFAGMMMWMLCSSAGAQGLFEQSLSEGRNNAPHITGYIRSLEWVGEKSGSDAWEQKSLYSEGALKIKGGLGKVGDALMDVRFREGLPFSYEGNGLDLREAYVNLYLGRVSCRVGNQINVWGRADNYNPTDNITPVNPLFHSPLSDDRRLGNFLVKGNLQISKTISLEGDWIPVYKPSVLPFRKKPLGPLVKYAGTIVPVHDLKNSGYAFRLNADVPAGGMSLSWFDGYEPYPGLQYRGFYFTPDSIPGIDIAAVPFREQVLGMDFETSLGSFDVRGEFGYRKTKNYTTDRNVALPDMRYVLGVDKTIGNFTMMVQYTGQYVLDLLPVKKPDDPTALPLEIIEYYNRLIFRQVYKTSHMFSLRPSLSVLHDVLNIEVYGEYNLTTKEYLIYPKIQWRASDRLQLTAGGNIFHGGDYSLYDQVRPLMNGVFMDCRLTF